MDADGYPRLGRGFRRYRGPCLAAHSGQEGEAQVVNQVKRGDRAAADFEPGMRNAGARPRRGLVVQLRVTLWGGSRAPVIDDGVA
jgi:hypothetical protein